MAFHHLIVDASLPATFPTSRRGHPDMAEQGCIYPGKPRQHHPILTAVWLSSEWVGGWVCKGEANLGLVKIIIKLCSSSVVLNC